MDLPGRRNQSASDGTEGSDAYHHPFRRHRRAKQCLCGDSGTGSIDTDRLDIRGGPDNDTMHLDANTANQQLVVKARNLRSVIGSGNHRTRYGHSCGH